MDISNADDLSLIVVALHALAIDRETYVKAARGPRHETAREYAAEQAKRARALAVRIDATIPPYAAHASGVAEGLAVKERAKIDGAGWRARNADPDVMPSEQVIRNHFSVSWSNRHFGLPPDKSVIWPIYRDTFLAACKVTP